MRHLNPKTNMKNYLQDQKSIVGSGARMKAIREALEKLKSK
jgi:hypothetical protein